MACSLLSGDQASVAAPIAWRTRGGVVESPNQPHAQARVAAPAPPEPPPPPPPPPVPQIDVEAIRQEAYARGMREGEQRAAERASAHLQPIIEKLSRTLASLIDQRSRIRHEAEAELLELAIAISRRILNRELTLDPLSVQSLIKLALEKAGHAEISRIRVHPDQKQTIETCIQRVRPSQACHIVADASLDPWGLVFETAKGNVDASLETQLNEIERGFADRLAR